MNLQHTAPVASLPGLAMAIRRNAAAMIAIQGFGYLGQAMSSAEIFAVLFGGGFVRPGHDRFVLSPGHYAVVFYAVMAELGLIPRDQLETYGLDGTQIEAIGSERTPLVDLTCGSLGQGLSGAIGFALSAQLRGEDRRTVAFLSDGEMEEGQTWEAAMFAAHRRLSALTVVVDANNSQVDGPVSSVTTLDPLGDKWRAFGWATFELDGHDIAALGAALGADTGGRPRAIIARTDIMGRMQSLPRTLDGHFIKLDEDLAAALADELDRASRGLAG